MSKERALMKYTLRMVAMEGILDKMREGVATEKEINLLKKLTILCRGSHNPKLSARVKKLLGGKEI